MAQSKIRGSTQIQDHSITAQQLALDLDLPLASIQNSTKILLADGSVAMTNDLSMGNKKLANLANAENPQDAVNLRTAQALVNGLAVKPSSTVVATTALTLVNQQIIDGKNCVVGDVVLATAQANAVQNGPWIVQNGPWIRPSYWENGSTQREGVLVLVSQGTQYHDTKWICITDGAVTVGTTPITWVQDQSGSSYVNGAGLDLAGNVFSVKNGDGLEFDGSNKLRMKTDGATLVVSPNGVKVADATPGQVMMAGASGAAAMKTVSGDATLSSGGVLQINDTATGFVRISNIVMNETPTGAMDGANVSFQVAFVPVGFFILTYNGQILDMGAGNDYTIVGKNITLTLVEPPASDDKLRAFYFK